VDKIKISFANLLQQPLKVFFYSVCFAVLLLLYDGSFWNLWSLHRNEKEMTKRIQAIYEDVQALHFKVEAARTHSFIERQATEQLGLVREDELVFVFADGE
jgi:cell division protein FtsB